MDKLEQSEMYAALENLVNAELSLLSRIAHGVLLAGALAMTIIVIALLLTEEYLPFRTQGAFAVLALLGLCWTSYAAWILARQRILFAQQRVVAGWLGLAFSLIFTVGGLYLGMSTGLQAGFTASGLGAILVCSAFVLLLHSRRKLAELRKRQSQLEQLRK